MADNEHSFPGDSPQALTYDSVVAILEAMAAGAAPNGRPLSMPSTVESPASELNLPGDGESSLKAVPVTDVTKQWSKATYHRVLDSLPDAVVVVDGRGLIRVVNRQTELMFGYRRQELHGRPVEVLVPARLRAAHVGHRESFFANPRVRPMGVGSELFGLKKGGAEFPVEISLSPLHTEDGTLTAATIRDITQKRAAEAELRGAQARYRTLVEEIPAVTFMASLDGGIHELYVSPQIEHLLGFSQQEWLENPVLWHMQLHPEDRDRWHREFARTCSTGAHFLSEYRFLARDGAVVWVHGEAKMVRDDQGRPMFLQGVAFDITDRKQAEQTLREAHDHLERQVQDRTAALGASLEEKEVLLKEIHHRVKNNLQLISSMLRLQSAGVDDAHTLRVIRDSQNRIQSMARIHQELYQSPDLAHIDFEQYTRALANNLIRSFGKGIHLVMQVHQVRFGIDTAIPCGLIMNELISNSLKYAFPDDRTGEIRIELTSQDNNQRTLTVADNGVGLPADLDVRNTDSLGLQLVSTLADQLGSTVTVDRVGGTSFSLCFAAEGTGDQAT